MGYFKSVPRELEEAARIDGASRWQGHDAHRAAAVHAGLLSAGIFAFTLAQNEFLLRADLPGQERGADGADRRSSPSSSAATCSTGASSLAGALLGSIPVAIIYSFFVDYYVAGLTAGAVKS